jgi:hypothetical protein
MTEYGDIFAYHLSTMGFEYLNLAFFAAYGLAVVWIVARAKSRALGPLQTT